MYNRCHLKLFFCYFTYLNKFSYVIYKSCNFCLHIFARLHAVCISHCPLMCTHIYARAFVVKISSPKYWRSSNTSNGVRPLLKVCYMLYGVHGVCVSLCTTQVAVHALSLSYLCSLVNRWSAMGKTGIVGKPAGAVVFGTRIVHPCYRWRIKGHKETQVIWGVASI